MPLPVAASMVMAARNPNMAHLPFVISTWRAYLQHHDTHTGYVATACEAMVPFVISTQKILSGYVADKREDLGQRDMVNAASRQTLLQSKSPCSESVGCELAKGLRTAAANHLQPSCGLEAEMTS